MDTTLSEGGSPQKTADWANPNRISAMHHRQQRRWGGRTIQKRGGTKGKELKELKEKALGDEELITD